MPMNCLTQKIELNYLIPAIRKEIIILFEKKLSDAEISRKLNITRAAISQYKHGKRGKTFKFDSKIKKEIKQSAVAIMKGKNANSEISKIIDMMKKSKSICSICKECGCK